MVFKACPRCNGDLYIEDDVGSRELVCLQCGSRQAYAVALNEVEPEDEANLVRWLQSHPTTIAA